MKVFTEVATLRRGRLPLHEREALDSEGQMDANWALRMDKIRRLRENFELAMGDARVVWNRKGAA